MINSFFNQGEKFMSKLIVLGLVASLSLIACGAKQAEAPVVEAVPVVEAAPPAAEVVADPAVAVSGGVAAGEPATKQVEK